MPRVLSLRWFKTLSCWQSIWTTTPRHLITYIEMFQNPNNAKSETFLFSFFFSFLFSFLVPGILDKVTQPVFIFEYFFPIFPWSSELHDLSKKKWWCCFPQTVRFLSIWGSAGLSYRLPWWCLLVEGGVIVLSSQFFWVGGTRVWWQKGQLCGNTGTS